MHEVAIAQSLLSVILEEAEKQNARPVRAMISCGKLSAVNDNALGFAFDIIAKGTICEGLELNIEQKPIRGRCKDCGNTFSIELDDPRCPSCNTDNFELLPDAPLMLEQIEFQTD